jgi:hypothetical protein
MNSSRNYTTTKLVILSHRPLAHLGVVVVLFRDRSQLAVVYILTQPQGAPVTFWKELAELSHCVLIMCHTVAPMPTKNAVKGMRKYLIKYNHRLPTITPH